MFHQVSFKIESSQPLQVIDISSMVREAIQGISARNGLVHVASRHTTMAICINEKCSALEKDMYSFLNRLVPPQAGYEHDKIAVDGRPNTHSHLLSLLIPSQVTIAMREGHLQLGTWQSIFAIELDGPREGRQVFVSIIGE